MSEHRKTVKRFHEPGDFHEFTFSCYRRLPLLMNEAWRLDLAESVDRAVLGGACRLIAYVFMPEHVHLLIQPETHQVRVDLLLKAIKAPFSSRVRRSLEVVASPLIDRLMVRERPGVHRFRFWQEGGGYDRNLRSVAAVEAAIAYIHKNPVRRGLCERSTDWRWSSARHYANDGGDPTQANVPPTVRGPNWDFYA